MGKLLSPRLALTMLVGLAVAVAVVTAVRAWQGPAADDAGQGSGEQVDAAPASAEPAGGDGGEAGETQSDGQRVAAAGPQRDVADTVHAVMAWFEMAATEPDAAVLQRSLEEIATPQAVQRTAELAQADESFAAHRLLLLSPGFSAMIAESIIAVRALSMRVEPLGEDRVSAEVWYTVVTVVPGGTGDAAYRLGRFELARGPGGWLLDSPAAGDQAAATALAPSVIRAQDSVAMTGDETLARLAGHGPVSSRGTAPR